MTEVRTIMTVAMGFVVIAAGFVALVIAGFHSKYSPEDLQRACAHRGGIAQIVDKTWSPGKEKALVVCRDGHVRGIRR